MSEKARTDLLDAFWGLYQTKNWHQITVKEVVARAGYHRSTFYEHFDDVRACLDELERRCLPNLDELPRDPNNVLDLYEQKAVYFNVLLGEHGDPGFRRRFIDSIKTSILEAPPGYFPHDLPLDAVERDLALEYRIAGLLAVLNRANTHHAHVSRTLLARAIFRAVGDS